MKLLKNRHFVGNPIMSFRKICIVLALLIILPSIHGCLSDDSISTPQDPIILNQNLQEMLATTWNISIFNRGSQNQTDKIDSHHSVIDHTGKIQYKENSTLSLNATHHISNPDISLQLPENDLERLRAVLLQIEWQENKKLAYGSEPCTTMHNGIDIQLTFENNTSFSTTIPGRNRYFCNEPDAIPVSIHELLSLNTQLITRMKEAANNWHIEITKQHDHNSSPIFIAKLTAADQRITIETEDDNTEKYISDTQLAFFKKLITSIDFENAELTPRTAGRCENTMEITIYYHDGYNTHELTIPANHPYHCNQVRTVPTHVHQTIYFMSKQ